MSMMETLGKRIAEIEADPERELDEELYADGRTKQAFKDETDVNRLVAKAQRGESLSHLAKHGAVYGDFTNVDDLLSAHATMERGMEIYRELPSEIKREMGFNPAEFFRYVNDPSNVDRLPELLPALAKPGRQHTVLNDPGRVSEPVSEPASEPVAEPPAEA